MYILYPDFGSPLPSIQVVSIVIVVSFDTCFVFFRALSRCYVMLWTDVVRCVMIKSVDCVFELGVYDLRAKDRAAVEVGAVVLVRSCLLRFNRYLHTTPSLHAFQC